MMMIPAMLMLLMLELELTRTGPVPVRRPTGALCVGRRRRRKSIFERTFGEMSPNVHQSTTCLLAASSLI